MTCQFISNCRICKMESPNLGKYMNLHLEIGAVPMHFLAMDTIKIRNTKSIYQYTFTLIDMLTNYVFAIHAVSAKIHEVVHVTYILHILLKKRFWTIAPGKYFCYHHIGSSLKMVIFSHMTFDLPTH